MNSKSTWTWIILAAGLFAFIFLFERYLRPPPAGLGRVLPSFHASLVNSISVIPAGRLEIRAARTNHAWQLTSPVVYPANATNIEILLSALEGLTLTNFITAGELRNLTNADKQYGFETPQFRLFVQQGDVHHQVLIGDRTAPGDQVFVGVVGSPGVYVVDANLLKFIPRMTNDWRDAAFVDLRNLTFDRITVTNGAKLFVELQRGPTNTLWHLTYPLKKSARADNNRIAVLLQKLQALNVAQFVTDDPKADLERFGLQTAELELALASATNTVAVLQFGKSLTNDAGLVYARRRGVDSIVAVAKDALAPWLAPLDDYRDHHLVTLDAPIDQIEIHGEDSFVVQRQPGKDWQLASQNLPVDSGRVEELLNALATMQITQFVNAVTAPDLRAYGLTAPARQIILRSAVTNNAEVTNIVRVQLSFGTNQEEKVFAQRADEDSVYAIALADFQQIPAVSWQLRERRIWNFSENDVARLTIHQDGKVRELIRNGTNSWMFAPGSQGIFDNTTAPFIDETVHRFGELAATYWAERGGHDRDRYGFNTNHYSLVFELKNGERRSVEFGGGVFPDYGYAAATLDGENWIFGFPMALYSLVLGFLRIPADIP